MDEIPEAIAAASPRSRCSRRSRPASASGRPALGRRPDLGRHGTLRAGRRHGAGARRGQLHHRLPRPQALRDGRAGRAEHPPCSAAAGRGGRHPAHDPALASAAAVRSTSCTSRRSRACAAIAEARARRRRRSSARCCTTTWPSRSEHYAAEDGMIYHNYPPLKSAADRDALWAAIAAATSTRSPPTTSPSRRRPSCPVAMVDNAPGGHNGIETRMDVLFSEGVAKSRLSIEQLRRGQCRGSRAAVRPLPAQGRPSPSAATPTWS